MARISTYTDGGELLPDDALIVVRSGGNVRAFSRLYDVAFYYPGSPAALEALSRVVIARPCYLRDADAVSRANAGVAATGAVTLSVRRNGTQVATVTWAAAATTGAVNVTGNQQFAAGEILDVINQDPADATLADVSITLALVLGTAP